MNHTDAVQLEEQSDSIRIVNDNIEVYEKGKTWVCPECGQGHGTEKDLGQRKCASCGVVMVDTRSNSRGDQTPANHPRTEGNGTSKGRQATIQESLEEDTQASLMEF